MGQEDDLNTSIAHIILCCVAGSGLSRRSGKTFSPPGMHANFLIHGVIGFLHYQSGKFNNDFTSLYTISLKASKYLALPCLMADLYSSDKTLSTIHLISGVVPFGLALSGNDNPHLGHMMVACNVLSLCWYSFKKENMWGWYTAGGAILAYFATLAVPHKIIYPLSLALMEYCSFKLTTRTFEF